MSQPKKRRIPILNIYYNNLDELDTLTREESFQKFVDDTTWEAIKEGLSHNEKTVKLFEIERTGKFISLKRNNWEKFLKKMNKKFEHDEQYEKCTECLKMIEKI